MQPLELVGSYMQMQARFVEAAAKAADGQEFARHMEAHDVMLRIDPTVEAEVWRGATISTRELDALRTIERVVRLGKVLRIGLERIVLEHGEIPAEPGHLYVDCTAAGVRPTTPRPIFEPGRVTLQYVTIGIAPWSAAAIGAVEALREDTAEKNRLCPPLVFTGRVADIPTIARNGITGAMARSGDREIATWNRTCRLDPARSASAHAADPVVADAYALMGTHLGPALENLAKIAG